MIHEENYNLVNLNTMRINSIAKDFYVLDSISEFCEFYDNKKIYLLSNGSNVLLPPEIELPVVSMMRLNKKLLLVNSEIYAGCSVRIQELINFCRVNNFGGLEYLYSVPSSVGGAAYSKTTPNWISNVDNASYYDILKLIKYGEIISRIFLVSPRLEIKVWK